MQHRDRVLTALHHETPDRCPMQISFTPEFADRLEADLQLKGQGLHNPHGGGNTYALERRLDEEMLLTSVGWINGYYAPGYRDVDFYVDECELAPEYQDQIIARTLYQTVSGG